jgi:hypothetical protein
VKVEKQRSEVTYSLELTAMEYSDIRTALYWLRDDDKFNADWRDRARELYRVMNDNA